MKSLVRWLGAGFDRRVALSTLIIVIFVLLAALVLPGIGFKSLAARWQERIEQIEVNKLRLERHQRLVSQKDQIVGEWMTYKDRFTVKQSAEQEVTVYLKQLEGLLSDAGLRVNNIRPMPNLKRNQNKELEELIIEFTVEGQMADWINFLHALSQSEDLLDVRAMSILKRRTGEEGNLAITAEITKTLFTA